jgi:peptide/nickel transport system ATP-binding protein
VNTMPSARAAATKGAASPLLSVRDLSIHFRSGRRSDNRVVDGVTFDIAKGETVGLVGESGSGKTVTGLALLGLLPRGIAWSQGNITFDGREIGSLPEREIQKLRGCRMAMIFQEPMTALDPVFTVGDQLAETIRTHFKIGKAEVRERALQALVDVGIPLPKQRLGEYPHQLSGGMRQRVMIAMSLCCEPDLLIADEPTTALDVTIQAQIIDLMAKLVQDRGTALIFISHNLGVVSQLCDRMLTMYAGQVVEDSPTDAALEKPLHPYTSGLLASVPRHSTGAARLPSIPGLVPSPGAMPEGCRFGPRCSHAEPECDIPQTLHQGTEGRYVRCSRFHELSLKGALS